MNDQSDNADLADGRFTPDADPVDVFMSLPANRRHRLVAALETGLLAAPYSAAAVGSAAGLREGAQVVVSALSAFEAMGVSGPACAAVIRAVERVEARIVRPDLVWSGPEVEGLYARDTRRVYQELLGSVERSAWVSSYAYFDGPRAFDVLARRMDALPQLDVTLLLNIQRKHGDTSASDDVVRRFADRFWCTDWPGSSRPRVFYDPRALDPEGPTGVLHAKAVVTDEESVFVTSANLTEAALDRNIEIGLLVRDRVLASSLICHFRGLIDRGLLSPLPMD
jgi:phosphatidylserine/phosphatidylglycerophosphate/cardiolipin synthase-like enzyme